MPRCDTLKCTRKTCATKLPNWRQYLFPAMLRQTEMRKSYLCVDVALIRTAIVLRDIIGREIYLKTDVISVDRLDIEINPGSESGVRPFRGNCLAFTDIFTRIETADARCSRRTPSPLTFPVRRGRRDRGRTGTSSRNESGPAKFLFDDRGDDEKRFSEERWAALGEFAHKTDVSSSTKTQKSYLADNKETQCQQTGTHTAVPYLTSPILFSLIRSACRLLLSRRLRIIVIFENSRRFQEISVQRPTFV